MIFVVLYAATADDTFNEITQQGMYLQHKFFDRVMTALGSRAAVYTMDQRIVHSKFLLADDRYMTIRSCNANERGFQLDSELNIAVDDAKLAAGFRKRLWAHNLGVTEAVIGAWSPGDFIAQWDAVANANALLAAQDMPGEGIVRWDYTKATGIWHVEIPDYLADSGSDAGDEPIGGGVVAVNDAGTPDDTSAGGGESGGTATA